MGYANQFKDLDLDRIEYVRAYQNQKRWKLINDINILRANLKTTDNNLTELDMLITDKKQVKVNDIITKYPKGEVTLREEEEFEPEPVIKESEQIALEEYNRETNRFDNLDMANEQIIPIEYADEELDTVRSDKFCEKEDHDEEGED